MENVSNFKYPADVLDSSKSCECELDSGSALPEADKMSDQIMDVSDLYFCRCPEIWTIDSFCIAYPKQTDRYMITKINPSIEELCVCGGGGLMWRRLSDY